MRGDLRRGRAGPVGEHVDEVAHLADDSPAALGRVGHPASRGDPSGVDAGAHHQTAVPARERVSHGARERREPSIVADHQARAGRLHGLAEDAQLLLVDRRGLLQKHVAPCRQRLRGESCVRVVSRRDDDRVDVGHTEASSSDAATPSAPNFSAACCALKPRLDTVRTSRAPGVFSKAGSRTPVAKDPVRPRPRRAGRGLATVARPWAPLPRCWRAPRADM